MAVKEPAGKTIADASGSPAVDPTKNVEDLVKALEAALEKLRIADNKRLEDLREADEKFNVTARESITKLNEAETRRVDQLATLRAGYEMQLESMRRASVDSTSTLLATQLREVKAELADRMSKQEQFRWETGGKTGGQTQLVSWGIAAAGVLFAIVVYLNK